MSKGPPVLAVLCFLWLCLVFSKVSKQRVEEIRGLTERPSHPGSNKVPAMALYPTYGLSRIPWGRNVKGNHCKELLRHDDANNHEPQTALVNNPQTNHDVTLDIG